MIETTEINDKDKKAIYVFGSGWCHKCREVQETIEKVESTFEGLPFYHIDVDKASDELLVKYNINEMPVITLFVKGRESNRYDEKDGALCDWLKFCYYF